jgi:glycosyltransferase involved in cell wall biosynthesis
MLVTTPWYEPFGITPLEAMACGTPVLGSRVGGIQYSVRDGETGLLVPPNDPDILGAQMARLYGEPGLLERMSRLSIDWVKQHFTWRKVTGQLARVYAEVHASRRAHLGGSPRALRTTRPALAKEVA